MVWKRLISQLKLPVETGSAWVDGGEPESSFYSPTQPPLKTSRSSSEELTILSQEPSIIAFTVESLVSPAFLKSVRIPIMGNRSEYLQ